MAEPLAPDVYRDLVRRALEEDLGSGDITTSATVPAGATGTARLLAKSPCVLAGLPIAGEVFRQVDERVRLEPLRSDGDACVPGDVVAMVDGPAAALMIGERTALNFLQHLSGIATRTRDFVEAAGGRLIVLDTRKTIPTLRLLAKYAVRCGGGTNHRAGLHDGVLIKDNHIRLAGGIQAAVDRVRAAGTRLPIEVETQSMDEVDQAIAAGADVIMLDNMTDADVRQAVGRIAGRARVEISGGVTLERMPQIGALGADTVSVGALTHSAPAADLSLEIVVG